MRRVRLSVVMLIGAVVAIFWPDTIQQMLTDAIDAEDRRERERFIQNGC